MKKPLDHATALAKAIMTGKPGPCPFCGATKGFGTDECYVHCSNCQGIGPDGENRADAIRLWNARK